MSHVVNQHLPAVRGVGMGFFVRLRRWFEARQQLRSVIERTRWEDDASPRLITSASSARLLAFPIRGEALLVRMAETLRRRVDSRRWERNPLVLTLSRQRHSRLTIDACAYVEFESGSSTYRVVLDAAPGTRFTVETSDFDMVVSFVAPYVTDRLSDAVSLEVAS